MIDEQPTSESMPAEAGDNFAQSEKQLGTDAQKLLRRYERLLDKHDKVIGEIHQVIIEFGRKLQEGQSMYGSGKEFGWWVERRHLNTTTMGINQQERSAAMKIARLHDHGSDLHEDDLEAGMVPAKLDLTGCKRTRPTDIIKWARKEQPHLFGDLTRIRRAAVGPAKRESLKNIPDVTADEIPEFKGNSQARRDKMRQAYASFLQTLTKEEQVEEVSTFFKRELKWTTKEISKFLNITRFEI